MATVQEEQEIQQKIEEYASFVQDVLRPDLFVAQEALDATQHEIREYQELRTKLKELKSSGRTKLVEPMVDLGFGKVQCKAAVDDTSTIFVHVGMGFHVELCIPEALVYLDKRIRFMEEQVMPPRVSQTKQIEQHLLSSGAVLDQLSHELKKMQVN